MTLLCRVPCLYASTLTTAQMGPLNEEACLHAHLFYPGLHGWIPGVVKAFNKASCAMCRRSPGESCWG